MVALCSKTYYCWDSDGRDKLSSKGLQKMANAKGLPYKVNHHARVIMNNMQATHPCLVSDWFTHKFHLYDISIIHLGQNVSQGPQPQDHQPQCQLRRPVQEPQGHVPDLPLGQASVPWRQWHPDSCLPGHHSHACLQLHGADFNQTMPGKFRLHNILLLDEDFPEALAYRPASWAWGGGEVSRGEDNKRASFIHQHALTMATATCAAEVHQHSSCRQQ